tara:strand:- start:55 stop:594 length:540 start_codon:yes stop_codon:yes gene_type:complete
MATINLEPNGTVSNNWALSTLGTANLMMVQDHTGTIATDGFCLRATSTGKIFELEFDDFTEDFSTIDSVQAVVKTGNNGRGKTFEIDMTINNGSSGTFWSAEGSGNQFASAGYRTQTFTSRTTSDGSSAWTNTDINNLRMKVELTSHSGGTTSSTYCYFIVTYTEPVATDNSVFFGTNF